MSDSITYYYRSVGTARNKWCIAVVFGSWPYSSLLHKGYLSSKEFFSRKMTADEYQRHISRWREYSVTYMSFEDLKKDEVQILGLDSVEYQSLLNAYNKLRNEH